MRLKSIEVLRGYAMGKTQLSKITDNIEREVEDALESEHSENTKLRELLDYMTPIAWYAASEREREHMRELGIEVDA